MDLLALPVDTAEVVVPLQAQRSQAMDITGGNHGD